MREIIVDAQILQTPAYKRGMGQYLLSLLDKLQKDKQTTLTLVFSSYIKSEQTIDAKDRLKDFEIVELPLLSLTETKNTKKALTANKKTLNNWLERQKYKNPLFIMSSVFQAEIYGAFPDNVIKSAIIYDVIPLQLFQQYSVNMRWGDYLDRYVNIYEAHKLFCISETTASDLQVYANVRPDTIVLLNGGPGNLASPKQPAQKPTKKFILMPTGNDIRKNNQLAVEAFERFNQRNESKYELVITSSFTDDERERLKSISQNVFFTGVISDEEIAWYYSKCASLLFPSLYEGLGMPLIEAMMFKKPIAASNIDVFYELSDTVAYYFNPYSVSLMSDAIDNSIKIGLTKEQINEANRIVEQYTWQHSADIIVDTYDNNTYTETKNISRKKIAVVGPHVTGASAIGKFIAELHPVLSLEFEVDYYYEKSPVDIILRPDILGHVTTYRPIKDLTSYRIKQYHEIIYHIGNSNHHTISFATALTNPGIVILHDLNLENIYQDLYRRKLIGKDRLLAEEKLDDLRPTKSAYLQSLLSNQNAVITHSGYAQEVADDIASSTKVYRAELAVGTPVYSPKRKNQTYTIGLAGILAGIKGIGTIEKIANKVEFSNDRILLFGLNFAEPGLLEKIRQIPNVEIATDLSDFEFQQNLKSLDVLINYRVKYQGEASYATLEAMRYGIPAIVRGDFGWYSELPDGSVLKAYSESEVVSLLTELKNDKELQISISNKSRNTTANKFSSSKYVNIIKDAIKETKE